MRESLESIAGIVVAYFLAGFIVDAMLTNEQIANSSGTLVELVFFVIIVAGAMVPMGIRSLIRKLKLRKKS